MNEWSSPRISAGLIYYFIRWLGSEGRPRQISSSMSFSPPSFSEAPLFRHVVTFRAMRYVRGLFYALPYLRDFRIAYARSLAFHRTQIIINLAMVENERKKKRKRKKMMYRPPCAAPSGAWHYRAYSNYSTRGAWRRDKRSTFGARKIQSRKENQFQKRN